MESESIIPNSSRCVVKNICISDVATGIIVFQKVYKWKESSAFYNLGAFSLHTTACFSMMLHFDTLQLGASLS